MLNKYIRFMLILISLVIIVMSFVSGAYLLTVCGALMCVYMLYAYFKYASVSLAFKKIRAKELKSAYNLLLDTPNPKLLSKGEKTYYYWGMGIIKISENKLDEAEREFFNALRYGATTANNMVIINLSLAQICMYKEEYEKAKVYLGEARRIPHRPQLNVILYELESRLLKLERQELLPEALEPISMV